jgi:hypothetical protein
MAAWRDFAASAPALAAEGERIFHLGPRFNNEPTDILGGLAYLATIRPDGWPRIHPISPVLHDGQLYAFIHRTSPKYRDLRHNGRYSLHSFPYPLNAAWGNEEFTVTGTATPSPDPTIRQAVANACGDPVEIGEVFVLSLERAMHRAAQNQDGKPVYAVWQVKVLADTLYDRYGKPLEGEHWGKYAVISEAGEVIVGEDDCALLVEAEARFHGDTFLFKIGPRVMGKI